MLPIVRESEFKRPTDNRTEDGANDSRITDLESPLDILDQDPPISNVFSISKLDADLQKDRTHPKETVGNPGR